MVLGREVGRSARGKSGRGREALALGLEPRQGPVQETARGQLGQVEGCRGLVGGRQGPLGPVVGCQGPVEGHPEPLGPVVGRQRPVEGRPGPEGVLPQPWGRVPHPRGKGW